MNEHVKGSEEKEERSEGDAERIASSTVNKYYDEHGKTKEEKKMKSQGAFSRAGPLLT